MLLNIGLTILPWGVPMYEWIIVLPAYPYPFLMAGLTNDFLINSKVLWQEILLPRRNMILSCGILLKHLEISPLITHVKWPPFICNCFRAECTPLLGLNP